MGVQMYGPAFDDSGKMVNRLVADEDVGAFERAGYVVGELEPEPEVEAAKEDKPKAKKK